MKALIIDDEPMPARHLAALIKQHCFEISFIEISNSASTAIEHLKEHQYDILFLDVEMPELSGFQFLEHVSLPHQTQIIFTTAYSEYAVQAFGVNATHYILKPVVEAELVNAVRKASKNILSGQPSANPIGEQTISIYDGEDYLILNEQDITRLEASGSYTKVITQSRGELLTSKRLGYYFDKLSPKLFFRCHHSHVINLKQVSKVSKGKSGYITLTNQELIPVSTSRKGELHELLNL